MGTFDDAEPGLDLGDLVGRSADVDGLCCGELEGFPSWNVTPSFPLSMRRALDERMSEYENGCRKRGCRWLVLRTVQWSYELGIRYVSFQYT